MLALLLSLGCSEYEFGDDVDPNDLADYDPPYSGETRLGCFTNYDGLMPWSRTEVWYDVEPPVDAEGRAWNDLVFDDAGWIELSGLPDRAPDTTEHEVYYRSVFWLDEVEGATTLGFKGNDGVWLFANEAFVGHWGGELREAGCVNVEEGCGVNYDEEPVDVTSFLRRGRNVLAVQLTNGPLGYFLDINAHCVR